MEGNGSVVKFQLPFPDSYWVIPGRLLAGEYPGAIEEHSARKKLVSLLHCGVNAVLNLTEEGELVDYASWLMEEAADFGLDVEIRRMPIRDFSTPGVVEMMAILNQMDEWLNQGKTVYVHCYGGIGRTGTVVGCYLVRKGLSPRQALQQIAELRRGTPDHWRRSPETDEQVEFVLSWRKDQ
ncbi:predicted protein-tyrosine phosphatase [Bellilinea caldifistulae]|uniref:protein-tyrosine phosphatase family protein n=1 Tax=Bellilinea caldifistulae TaxID=360411 RepID=UPI0007862351|nr:dual specificity protein phosphatase family protein [Bellilinea caldifistulae]GAP10309.1 predicted protein-tyrosine phosphatase [Bellilinea caldifistulae]